MATPARPQPATTPTNRLSAVPVVSAPPPGPTIPGYEIIRELGSGGMGVVYLARHSELGRTVALKMLRDGSLADDDTRTRFAEEARAAARLRHPGIVQLYEFGTAQHLPYVAMEYVDGPTLARHLDGKPQPPAWSAGLVERVARAMQSAHEQGVIHRDLKPANILLSNDERRTMNDEQKTTAGSDSSFIVHRSSLLPKVSDFGLAKIVGEVGVRTETGIVAGTPGYMAPEQVRGSRDLIGPWTDVYALGVILYECLTGRRPFADDNPAAVMIATTLTDPPGPRRFRPDVPRDLETICLKCLARKPEERYLTAAALAADLERFLGGRTILARRASPAERAWKFVRRNPLVCALSAALVASLAVGFVVASVLYLRAEERLARAERDREAAELAAGREAVARSDAEQATASAVAAATAAGRAEARTAAALAEVTARQSDLEAINEFLLDDILAAPRPRGYGPGGRGPDITLRAALDSAAAAIPVRLRDKPALAAAAEHAVGESYRQLGDYAAAVPHLERALDLRERHTPNDHVGLNRARRSLALAWGVTGKEKAAAELFRRVLADLAARPAPHFEGLVRRDLGLCLKQMGDAAGAVEMLESAHAIQARVLGPDHPQTLTCLVGLGTAHLKAGRGDQALAIGRDATTRAEKVCGADALVTGYALALVGGSLAANPAEAEEPLRRATGIHTACVGPAHPDTLHLTLALATVLVRQRKFAEAETVLRPAVACAPGVLGAAHATTFGLRDKLAQALVMLRKWDDAERVVADLVEAHREHRPAELKVAESILAKIREMKGRRPVAPPPRAAQRRD